MSKRFTKRALPFCFFGEGGLGDSSASGEPGPSGVSGVFADLAANPSFGVIGSDGGGASRALEPSGSSAASGSSGSTDAFYDLPNSRRIRLRNLMPRNHADSANAIG